MAHIIPSLFIQSDDGQTESGCLSDSDLPSGPPSLDVSDDEDIQNCKDTGITNPYFFNKLREQTRPLFHVSHDLSPGGVSMPQEHVIDRSQRSRNKKRFTKENGGETQSGMIERHYGYVPNPRWPKAQNSTKPFNPKGLDRGDGENIPGIAFRDKTLKNHSYQECDFPELNSMSKDESSSMVAGLSPSNTNAGFLPKQASLDMSKDGRPQLTSTPRRHEIVSPSDHSLITEKSPMLGNTLQSSGSKPNESQCKNKSGKNSRRRSKKSLMSPLASAPLQPQEHSLSDSSDFNFSNSVLSQGHRSIEEVRVELTVSGRNHSKSESSASDMPHMVPDGKNKSGRKSGSFQASAIPSHMLANTEIYHQTTATEKDKRPDQNAKTDEKQRINGNTIQSPSWSQIASRSSSPVPLNNSAEDINFQPHPALTIEAQASGQSWSHVLKSSPLHSPKAGEEVKTNGNRSLMDADRRSSPVPVTAQGSGSYNEANARRRSFSKVLSPVAVDSCVDPLPSRQSHDSIVSNCRPNSPLCLPAKACSPHSPGSGRRKSKGKSMETKHQAPNDNIRAKENDRQAYQTNNRCARNKGERQRVQLLTLDNFITPKKSNKKPWPTHHTKDINAFENRFIEHIEASSNSPPKKVRPSPIKMLNFSLQGGQNSSSESDTTKGENILSGSDELKVPIIKRQMSLIRDLDWQKTNFNKEGCQQTKKGKGSGNAAQSQRNSSVVFCLEEYMKDSKVLKDVLSDGETDADQLDIETTKEVKEFWTHIALYETKPNPDRKLSAVSDTNGKPKHRNKKNNLFKYFPKSSTGMTDCSVEDIDVPFVSKTDLADPVKVTLKAQLKKYARRYCHIVENYQISSIAEEIQFILQLLTPSQLDQDMLKAVDSKVGGSAFRSVHNSVYFAVHIMKRLRRLFLCLPFPILHLLTHNLRIAAFSPKLHACFMGALSSFKPELMTSPPLEHTPFKTLDNGVGSFPDTNFAHVFKCQRDNFYALYRQYHDVSGTHPFNMEEQIQYVYDCRTPEQNSITNLMHLAELYVEHLIQCCLSRAYEQRKEIVLMIEYQDRDNTKFDRLLSDFLRNHTNGGNSLFPNGVPKVDAFFIDFVQMLRCPAFNENLKNLLVTKILELNGKSFDGVRNLHSAVIIGDDKVPERSHDFSATVSSLCAMSRILGHLVFSPYTTGTQDLTVYQEANMLKMREMVPLPFPLPLLLKQAYEDGHLSLTVPWVADFLSTMDQAAPKLSVYRSLLHRLKYIQRYSWKTLFMKGHHNSGLLVVSSVSKLFQTVTTPAHLSLFCDEPMNKPAVEFQGEKQIDCQRLVPSALLYTCCPHFVKSCGPLAVFAMPQNTIRLSRKIMPLIPQGKGAFKGTKSKRGESDQAIRQWLGSSVQSSKKGSVLNQDIDKSGAPGKESCVQKEVELPLDSAHFFPGLNERVQNELKTNLVDGTPYLRNVVTTAVDLLCGRAEEYTLNVILKVGAFEAKREVRSRFLNMEKGDDAEIVKSQVLIHANILANKFSTEVRHAFFQIGEKACRKDLIQLVTFLTSCVDEKSRGIIIHIAEENMVQRLKEWASVQLGPDYFRRLIIREAEKCGRPNSKSFSLFPSDFSQKIEQSDVALDVQNGFADLMQLSEILDKALSCGVWYINALTPGSRPDESFMLTLINELISCVEKRMVTIDFAFYVMANFLMHLIIQYIMDAPFNWTEACMEAFVKLCLLCEVRKSEGDRLEVRLNDAVRKTKNVKVRVANLVSVFSLQWLAKSVVLDHSLMVYCQTLVRVVEAGLMTIEFLIHMLMNTRGNHHLTDSSRNIIDRIILKVLALLYASDCENEACSPPRILTLVLSVKQRFEEWQSTKVLNDLKTAFGSVVIC